MHQKIKFPTSNLISLQAWKLNDDLGYLIIKGIFGRDVVRLRESGSIRVSVCLSVGLFVYLSVCLSALLGRSVCIDFVS